MCQLSSDNCAGGGLSQSAGLASGAAFSVGTTVNSFTATDASGNTATCSFTVTVSDNEA
ncbi:MAG: HYR domain-containing protein [Bacteroidia bacterium]